MMCFRIVNTGREGLRNKKRQIIHFFVDMGGGSLKVNKQWGGGDGVGGGGCPGG